MPKAHQSSIACIMSTEDAQKLHARADYFRAISLDGNDVHLKVALLQLAEDFDLEAAQVEGRQAHLCEGYDDMVRQNPIDRGAEPESARAPDRRRPGRRDDVSPALLPLLREDLSAQLREHLIDEEPDQLRSFRGIMLWVLISAALLALLLWWVV
jgi:hypothetical protein